MYLIEEPVIYENMEKLAPIGGQKEDIGQSSEVVMKRKDQNFILMLNKEMLSQRGKPMNLVIIIDEEQLQENANA